jgi:hypothetical protein
MLGHAPRPAITEVSNDTDLPHCSSRSCTNALQSAWTIVELLCFQEDERLYPT